MHSNKILLKWNVIYCKCSESKSAVYGLIVLLSWFLVMIINFTIDSKELSEDVGGTELYTAL